MPRLLPDLPSWPSRVHSSVAMRDTIQTILDAAARDVADAGDDSKALEALRVRYLGRKGEFSRCFKELALASADQRPQLGQLLNDAKAQIEGALTAALERAREQVRRPAENRRALRALRRRDHRAVGGLRQGRRDPQERGHHDAQDLVAPGT